VKPYYEEAGITIYHGDFRALVEQIPVADCVIADPPYAQTSLDWDVWPIGWPSVVSARAKSMWVFGTMRMFMGRAAEFNSWNLSQDLTWEKQNGSSFHADRFRRVHESIVHFYRDAWEVIYKNPVMTLDATSRVTRRKMRPYHMGKIAEAAYVSHDGGPRLMRSVVYEPNCHGFAENETQKPLGIIRPLIEYSCPPDGLLFDPFCGSGSAMVAAKEMSRRAIGVDIREEQCEIAANRLRQSVLNFEVA
jgi:site-specific DNA-methyltransferase (adenine-specific)